MGDISAVEVRDQLERILRSRAFARAERMKQFLTFIVNESLAGRADTLKENVIAHTVYRRSIEFDGGIDPIVRVDARRLRDKLREYYADNPDDLPVIGLPRGGYVPHIAQYNNYVAPSVGVTALRARRSLAGLIALTLCLILAFGYLIFWLREPSPKTGPNNYAPRLQAVPLTSYIGHERHPSLSPDGSQLAFAWESGESSGFDIYVKVIGEDRALQLTATDADEVSPSWSPDGRWIAFVRDSGNGPGAIYVVSPLGGAERKVTGPGDDVAWSPDSGSIVFSREDEATANRAIYRLTIATQTLEQLTFPQRSAVDFGAALASNSQTLAFIRCATPARYDCDVFIKTLDEQERARRLTRFDLPIGGLAWMPDGQKLVFSVSGELYRVSTSGGERQRLGIAGTAPSVAARSRDLRLAFQRHHSDTSIWRTRILLDNSSEPIAIGASKLLIDSTRGEGNPVVSPDGQMLVFASNRSGPWVAWAADANGTSIQPFSKRINGQFNWSPDGTQVAGLCVDEADDRSDICVVDVDTGHGVTIAASPYADALPIWSADGNKIYFISDRSGRAEVWTVNVKGGAPIQLTQDGALLSAMAFGRTEIFYYPDPVSPRNWAQELWRMSLDDGETQKVLDRVYPFAHVDSSSGLYWLEFDEARIDLPKVKYLSKGSGAIRTLGKLPHKVSGTFPDLAISPDEAWLYTVRAEDADTDILFIRDSR